MGLHKNIARIHGEMLENAVYRIKTQLGVSVGSYSHSPTRPVYGTGQGSCASPPFWLLNCSKYFDIYDKSCFGASYVDMSGNRILKWGMVGFVDDCCCNANCFPQNEQSLIAKATQDAQLWSDILWSSGGALEHSKCAYHYLQTEFTETGRPYFRGGKFGDPITIKDNFGKATTLEQLSAYVPFKTLGTHQAPTHCQKIQFNVLKKKAGSLARVLALSACSANAAWLFYSSIFMKGIGYPLPVSQLSKNQLRALQGPIVSIALNRMHFPKTTARVLVYGPRSLGGLEFGSLATFQGAGKIILLLRHLRTPGHPHELILVVLDRFQYMAGVGFNILQDTQTPLPHLEGIWIPTARQYLGTIASSLQIAGMTVQSLERHGDQYIMDIVLASDRFAPAEVKFVNYCRLFLQVLTVSDLCHAAGTELAEGILDGYRHSSQSWSSFHEPFQERPNNRVWGIWRRFLKLICYDNDQLNRPLGPWFARRSDRRVWPNYYLPLGDCIHVMTNGDYKTHKMIRTRVFDHSSSATPEAELIGFPVPVDISVMTDGLRMSVPKMDPYSSEPANTPPLTFVEYIQALPEHESLILKHFELLAGEVEIMCNLISTMDDVILVSDGGAADDYGSYGWVLGLSNGTRLEQGWGKEYGHDPKSYRAEGFNAKAGTLFLWHVFLYYKRPVPELGVFTFYCDNEGLLKKLLVFRSYENVAQATCLHSEWDIVSAIHTLHCQFPGIPNLLHVPSHQDDYYDISDLDLPTQMNIDGTSQPVVPFDPSCGVMLSINGRSTTRNIEATIHRHEHTGPLQDYYCSRFGWNQATFQSIDWDVYAMVYKKFPPTRTFYSKFGWKQLPTGATLHRRSPSFDHRCPSCSHEFETDDHIFQCVHISRSDWRHSLIREIEDTFGSFLDPELITIVKIGLTSFFTDTHPEFAPRFQECSSICHYLDLIAQQQFIGWDQFIRGCLGKLWGPKRSARSSKYGNVCEENERAIKGVERRIFRACKESDFSDR